MNRGQTSMKNLFSSFLPTKQEELPELQENPGKKAKSKKKAKAKAKANQKAPPQKQKYKKQKISAALREQVWIQHSGRVFERKCMVAWCKNTITVFDFQCGHDIPESKGGATDITNLYPICGKCNLSMSNTYTLKEWSALYTAVTEPIPTAKPSFFGRYFSCFRKRI